MSVQTRLPFELDVRAEAGMLTAYGGVPLLIEAFRVSGAALVVDERVSIKRRKRGLSPAALVEGLFALWAAGGEHCEDLDPLREDAALAILLGHGIPAPQTARDFLEAFDERCRRCGRARRARSRARASGSRAWPRPAAG
jgi:hypothetical protein